MGPLEIALTCGVAILGFLNAWLLFGMQSLRAELHQLRTADNELGKELSGVKVLVAGNYVTREEFHSGMNQQTKVILDRMENIVQRYAVPHSKGSD